MNKKHMIRLMAILLVICCSQINVVLSHAAKKSDQISSADFLFEVGLKHIEKGQIKEAVHELSKVLLIEENHEAALHHLKLLGYDRGLYKQPRTLSSEVIRDKQNGLDRQDMKTYDSTYKKSTPYVDSYVSTARPQRKIQKKESFVKAHDQRMQLIMNDLDETKDKLIMQANEHKAKRLENTSDVDARIHNDAFIERQLVLSDQIIKDLVNASVTLEDIERVSLAPAIIDQLDELKIRCHQYLNATKKILNHLDQGQPIEVSMQPQVEHLNQEIKELSMKIEQDKMNELPENIVFVEDYRDQYEDLVDEPKLTYKPRTKGRWMNGLKRTMFSVGDGIGKTVQAFKDLEKDTFFKPGPLEPQKQRQLQRLTKQHQTTKKQLNRRMDKLEQNHSSQMRDWDLKLRNYPRYATNLSERKQVPVTQVNQVSQVQSFSEWDNMDYTVKPLLAQERVQGYVEMDQPSKSTNSMKRSLSINADPVYVSASKRRVMEKEKIYLNQQEQQMVQEMAQLESTTNSQALRKELSDLQALMAQHIKEKNNRYDDLNRDYEQVQVQLMKMDQNSIENNELKNELNRLQSVMAQHIEKKNQTINDLKRDYEDVQAELMAANESLDNGLKNEKQMAQLSQSYEALKQQHLDQRIKMDHLYNQIENYLYVRRNHMKALEDKVIYQEMELARNENSELNKTDALIYYNERMNEYESQLDQLNDNLTSKNEFISEQNKTLYKLDKESKDVK